MSLRSSITSMEPIVILKTNSILSWLLKRYFLKGMNVVWMSGSSFGSRPFPFPNSIPGSVKPLKP